MEACGGSHFLGRALREQRHEVRLIPAQYVKPYVKTNKSDYIDAEAPASPLLSPVREGIESDSGAAMSQRVAIRAVQNGGAA